MRKVVSVLVVVLGMYAGRPGLAAPVDVRVSHANDAPHAAPHANDAPRAEPLQRGGGSCGDYRCDPPEDCNSCPQDCGRCCGNRRCEPPEDCNSCPSDCGPCRR